MVPDYHQVDPTHPRQGYIGAQWGRVKTFLLDSPSQFRAPNLVGNTPASRAIYLNSSAYTAEINEVKSSGSKTSIQRTIDQTIIGIAWAYDGIPRIGTPQRLYNQIVHVIAIQQRNSLEQNVQLFTLVNYAMADAAIAAWDTKYFYQFWRPTLGIRKSPNVFYIDETWIPLGAPAAGFDQDFTPACLAYVSGHATLGTSTFQALRLFYNRDNIPFNFQSDEFNGKTKDSNTGQVRPALSRGYSSFTAAEIENAESRIYLGVHWRSDVMQGRLLDQQVATEAFRKFL